MKLRQFLLPASILSFAAAYGPQPPSSRPAQVVTYDPGSNVIDGQIFATWLQQNAASGQVAVKQGVYTVKPPTNNPQAHIYVYGARNLRIWMDKVNLTMTQPALTAIKFDTCSNVTLVGPTMWWNEPGFSQGSITAVRPQGNGIYQFDFVPDAGYNNQFLFDSNNNLNAEYTNPANYRLWASPSYSVISNQATNNNSDGSYTVTPSQTLGFVPLVGFKLLARPTFLFCNWITNSNTTTIIDFTILNCGGFGFFLSFNRATSFQSFQIKPADFPPPGGTQLPARACSADGIHSAEDYTGPSIDSSYFSAMDDDCVAVHGILSFILGFGSSQNQIWSSRVAAVGESMKFYTPVNFDLMGTATVTQVSYPAGAPSGAAALLTFASVPQGLAINNPFINTNRLGSSYSLTNTQTFSNRGRGIIAKANFGLIQNNYFEGVSYAAINIGPEFTYAQEGDYASYVNVFNNYIKDCNYIDQATAAIHLHGDGDNRIDGNSNIVFNNNTVVNTTAANLYIGASSSVTLSQTKFLQPYQIPYSLYNSWPGSDSAIATFQNVSFRQVVSNCYDNSNLPSNIQMANNLGTVSGYRAVPTC